MWFWLITSIAGSIIGSASDTWFRDTKMGMWFYAKVDDVYTWANNRYGLKILTNEREKMKKFPKLEKRLIELENQVREIKDGRE